MLAGARDRSIVSLAPQIDAMNDRVNWLLANPPHNLDDFIWDMNTLTGDMEAVRETIHDYVTMVRLRSAQLLTGEADDYSAGAAKYLADYMENMSDDLTKVMDRVVENAKTVGLSDVQIARLNDLDRISRSEIDNIISTKTKLATIESEIPPFHKANRALRRTDPEKADAMSHKFWDSQKARKADIWADSNLAADQLKIARLGASRNFLMSVDRPVFVPDSIPEVVDKLTANHIAYLYGATGDDLYRGLTRVSHDTRVRPRKDFILHTKEQADAYASKFGKTAEQIGFTDDAIGEVYDQMWRSLGIDPNVLTPDSPIASLP